MELNTIKFLLGTPDAFNDAHLESMIFSKLCKATSFVVPAKQGNKYY